MTAPSKRWMAYAAGFGFGPPVERPDDAVPALRRVMVEQTLDDIRAEPDGGALLESLLRGIEHPVLIHIAGPDEVVSHVSGVLADLAV